MLQPEAATEPARELDALRLVRDWKWFAYVPPEGRQWLAERALTRRIEKGRTVYVAGEAVTQVYAVVSGVFRIYMTSYRGDDITLEEVVSGGWFPHFSPLDKPRYAGSCVCQADAVVAAFPLPALLEFARRWPAYYKGLYHELTDRAAVTLGRIELLSLHNLNVRMAVYLLRMAHLRGKPGTDGSIWVEAYESQSELGARIGGTRQRVNSVLKVWAGKGLLELHKDGVRILDLRRLTAEAEKSGFDVKAYLASWHGGWQGKA